MIEHPKFNKYRDLIEDELSILVGVTKEVFEKVNWKSEQSDSGEISHHKTD